MKLALAPLSLFGLFSVAPTYAQDAAPAPDWTLAGSVAVQSDYRFRGISQSDKNPVPQGALNLTGPDGWYVGTWISQINWQLGGENENPSIEWDIYGGKHFDLGGTDLNVEAYEYAYPDANTFGGSDASYFEGIFTLTHAFGPLSLDAVWAISPEFSLGGGTGNYLEGQAVFTVTDWLTVSANVGHQWVDLAPSDYTHADFGATASWNGFALDARYVTTDIGQTNCAGFWMGTKNACSGGFVATLTYNIAILP
ncbi:MAG TPA: TorF family putative porin [Rhizomicrobium sp.]|nr:TorF family putative porin [Rhizomicrobium sp.]